MVAYASFTTADDRPNATSSRFHFSFTPMPSRRRQKPRPCRHDRMRDFRHHYRYLRRSASPPSVMRAVESYIFRYQARAVRARIAPHARAACEASYFQGHAAPDARAAGVKSYYRSAPSRRRRATAPRPVRHHRRHSRSGRHLTKGRMSRSVEEFSYYRAAAARFAQAAQQRGGALSATAPFSGMVSTAFSSRKITACRARRSSCQGATMTYHTTRHRARQHRTFHTVRRILDGPPRRMTAAASSLSFSRRRPPNAYSRFNVDSSGACSSFSSLPPESMPSQRRPAITSRYRHKYHTHEGRLFLFSTASASPRTTARPSIHILAETRRLQTSHFSASPYMTSAERRDASHEYTLLQAAFEERRYFVSRFSRSASCFADYRKRASIHSHIHIDAAAAVE